MNDFANGFLKGYKAAVEDVTPGFFANKETYSGFADSGVFTYFLKNITMLDYNEDGVPEVYTFEEYLSNCLEDWLVSHYAEIKRDFEEEDWFNNMNS